MNIARGAILHNDRIESDDAQMQESRDRGKRTNIVCHGEFDGEKLRVNGKSRAEKQRKRKKQRKEKENEKKQGLNFRKLHTFNCHEFWQK